MIFSRSSAIALSADEIEPSRSHGLISLSSISYSFAHQNVEMNGVLHGFVTIIESSGRGGNCAVA
jgi:hypothetical protein